MRRFRLERPDIQPALDEARSAALVHHHWRIECVWIERRIPVINCNASRGKRHRRSRASVVLQRAEQGIDVYEVFSARARVPVGVADYVVAATEECPGDVRSRWRGVPYGDGVRDPYKRSVTVLIEDAATAGRFSRRVSRDGAIIQNQHP